MAVNIIKRTWHQNQMVKIEPLNGFAFQAENGGHTFQISGVDDSGNAVPISGTIAGVFLRPDNTDVALTGSASGGVASVTLKAECYAVPGRFLLTVYATSGSNKGTIYAAMGTVSRTSSGAVSPAAASDVVDLVNRINAATATIPASYTTLLNAVAGDYSDTKTYAVKDFVWYNGHLYRCTTAITTAETWTASHWTQVVLSDALNQDITLLKSAIVGYAQSGETAYSTYIQGARNALTPETVASRRDRCTTGAVLHLYKGDSVSVTGIATGHKFVLASSTGYDSGWQTNDFSYTADADMDVIANVAATNGTDNILPASITAVIKITDKSSRIYRNETALQSIDDNIKRCADIIGVGVDISEGISFTNGKFIVPSTGLTQNSGIQSYSNFIAIPDGGELLTISMVVRPDDYGQGIAFYSSSTEDSYISGIRAKKDSTLSELGDVTETVRIPATAKYFRTSWIATTYQYYNQHTFVCQIAKTGELKPASSIADYIEDIDIDGIIKITKTEMESGSYTDSGFVPNPERCRNANHYIKARKGDIVVGHHKTAHILMGVIDSPTGTTTLYSSDWRIYDFALATPCDGYYVFLGAAGVDEFDGDFTIYPAKQLFRGLPERYYLDEIATTLATITAKQSEPCLCFPLITDIHYGAFTSSDHPYLFYKTYRNLLAIMQKKRSDAVVCLGDVTDGMFSPKSTAIEFGERLNNMFRLLPAPYLLTIGNHDDNRYAQSSTDHFTDADTYSVNTAYSDGRVNFNALTNGRDYYVDYDNIKIRLISLFAFADSDTKYSDDTVTWFENIALDTPAGYLAVILTHISPISSQNYFDSSVINGDRIAQAIENYIASGKDAFQLYGHSHADAAYTTPYLSIATCCNKFTNSNGDPALWPSGATMPERVEYTASEDLWDFVIIKPQSKIVSLIRFGAGNDREFSYGN